MSDATTVFVSAKPYDEAKEKARFSRFEPSTRVLPAGFQYSKRYAPLRESLVFEKDTAVTLRDGVTIYTDIFRPVGDGPFPVIISWSPYGKNSGPSRFYTILRTFAAVDQRKLSGLMKWEAVDPARWCPQGYAVCHPDARGAKNSEGDIQFFGEQEGRDIHDVIEWLAAQPWCNGKVGMAGNSWLAVSQWFAAAERPPHLAAIAPWEGMSDIYRNTLAPGGIDDSGFLNAVMKGLTGHQKAESPELGLRRHPLFDDYWQTKAAKVEQATVPAYVVASYSNTVHASGTFSAWRRLGSEQKWLRIHNTLEWTDFYDEAYQQDLLRFFDHFLKGAENGWERTPQVRYALLDLEGGDIVNRPASQFPPPGVTNTPFYLDSRARRLTTAAPSGEVTCGYNAESGKGQVEFNVAFDRETEIVGHPKVKLWVEADGHDDMDLFVFLQKLDRKGRHLAVQTNGANVPIVRLLTLFTATVFKYQAAPGRLRVSLRKLDPKLSTPDVPVHSLTEPEKLRPGQIFPVEIPLYPVGLLLHSGEQLRLIVTGHTIMGAPMPGSAKPKTDNHGRHIIHTGGKYDSHLVLPIHR